MKNNKSIIKMPLLNISTNYKINNEKMLLSKSSDFIASLINKPENFVMIKLNDSLPMYFSGNDQPCCFIEIKSIGSLVPSKITKSIFEFFSSELEIPVERIYVYYQDVDSNMWAWKNSTFG